MSEESKDITAAEFFGPAHEQWSAAINALHAFAHADGCPVGVDVVSYFDRRTEAYRDAQYAARGTIRAIHMDLSQDGELTPVKEGE